jgi:uncharacterized membrane protein YfcA
MEFRDWFDAVFFIVIGALLGSVASNLMQLTSTAFWIMVVISLLIFSGVFLFELVTDKLIDRIFPSGVRAARKPQAQGRRPLILLLSLPAGFVLGILLAKFGFDNTIIELLSQQLRLFLVHLPA